MATVYVLYSPTLDRYYTGSCDEFTQRLDQHISKEFSDSFTAKADDWMVFLRFDNLGYAQARSIEGHIKKMKSSVYIQNLKKYPEIIERLIVKYS